MDAAQRRLVPVSDAADVLHARETARELARALGFPAQAAAEIALAVSEAASNLVQHASGGSLTLMALDPHERPGIEIEALDHGPGFLDVEQALADGFSTTGSLGCGLGAINRLMDQLEITSKPGTGTRLVCRRWLRMPGSSSRPCPLAFGVATRALAPFEGNGDAFVIKRWSDSALVALIDGLGHGKHAQRAAQAARHYVETHFDQPLADIFRGTSRVCRGTRGVVMALALFDWGARKLAFASIGDVEVRVFGTAQRLNWNIRRGVLGGNAPDAAVTEHEWKPEYVMVLHTDGIRRHWNWQDFPELANASATLAAQLLLRALAKDNDDATVMVIREDRP